MIAYIDDFWFMLYLTGAPVMPYCSSLFRPAAAGAIVEDPQAVMD